LSKVDRGKYAKKCQCPRCAERGGDTSKDNLHYYGEGKGSYCHVCSYTEPSDDWLAEHKENKTEEEIEVATREPITDEENEQIKGYTGVDGKGFRGIRKEINAFFGVRYQYNEETGEPIKEFVPTTIDGKLVGYKTRVFPKDFKHPIGAVGKECDMIGQFRFKNHTRTVIIVGGEIKQRAAYQMLLDNQKSRGKDEYETVAVVSPTTGETGAHRQVQAQYEFFSQFAKIIVCMDSDEAGKKANEDICKVLPAGKGYIMKMRYKDADEYIRLGKEHEFIDDYWKSRPHLPTGIVGSGELYDAVIEEALRPKLRLPSFMKTLNQMTADGIPLGTVGVVSAFTGQAKSTIVNECIYDWIFSSPYKMGVVSMEQNKGQYGELMLSRHIGIKLGNLPQENKLEVLRSDRTIEMQKELFYNEDGSDRWMVVDDRDGDVESLKAAIEQLVIACDCKVVVVDTISDMFDGLTTDEQAVLMKWQKSIVNRYDCSIINVSHQRKTGTGEKDGSEGALGNESGLHGSSTLSKSAAWILVVGRDKANEDPIIRNTTNMLLLKCRWSGQTGPAGKLYYDNLVHKLYDFDEWAASQNNGF